MAKDKRRALMERLRRVAYQQERMARAMAKVADDRAIGAVRAVTELDAAEREDDRRAREKGPGAAWGTTRADRREVVEVERVVLKTEEDAAKSRAAAAAQKHKRSHQLYRKLDSVTAQLREQHRLEAERREQSEMEDLGRGRDAGD